MTPLISVTMPCYNAAKTLPLALASLLAHTYENWECVLVDDGSTDDPRAIVEHVNDPRIRYIRLDQNRGRGVARQIALDCASGDYLCMLDADDWIYPSKLERQVAAMEQHPGITLLSTGMAIVNAQNEIVGVRAQGPQAADLVVQGPLTRLGMPPVAHAPSMIRMQVAKQAKYDPHFLMGQDVDFLLQVLMGRYYCVLPDVTYVYSELESITLDKILRTSIYNRQMFQKYTKRFPIASRVNMGQVFTKSIVYRIVFALGLGTWMIRRRSQKPTEQNVRDFKQALQIVSSVASQRFQD